MSLYLHIPFCHRICTYCDFVKEVINPGKIDRYLNALRAEFSHVQPSLNTVKTIFIGGGTPSSLSVADLTRLFDIIDAHVKVQTLDEFTIECNPEDITPEKAALFKTRGVNRVSLGVQSFNRQHLTFLNRNHHAEDVVNAVNILRDHRFDNISIDMLFALVDQTLVDLNADIDAALDLDVDHISYYSLILEPGTKLYTMVEKGAVSLVDETTESAMYEVVIERLTNAGYHHYEVSNFAKPQHHCLHNVRIWRDHDYIGIGVGAHSKVNNERRQHTHRLKHYLDQAEQGQFEQTIYPYEPKRDMLLMGLRLLKGINLSEYHSRFNIDLFDDYPALKTYLKQGLLEAVDGHIRFTKKGLFLGNEIFELF